MLEETGNCHRNIFSLDEIANKLFYSLVPSDVRRGRSTNCNESLPSREELVIKRSLAWTMVNYRRLDGKLK